MDKKIPIIIVVLIVILGGYWFYSSNSNNQMSNDNANTSANVPADLNSVYTKYCSSGISSTKSDYSQNFIKELTDTDLSSIISKLAENKYLPAQIPMALYYVGFKNLQTGNFDEFLRFNQCTAEKYYNMIAMYRMASLYKHGTSAIREQIPNLTTTTEITPDFSKAYHWIASLMYMEQAEKTGLLNTDTQFGWNAIAMLDDLQNTGKLSSDEMTRIEDGVKAFVGKRYPEVLRGN